MLAAKTLDKHTFLVEYADYSIDQATEIMQKTDQDTVNELMIQMQAQLMMAGAAGEGGEEKENGKEEKKE